MSFQTVKLSEEFLASFNANPTNFAEKITALLAAKDAEIAKLTADSQVKVVESVTTNAAFESRLATIESAITASAKDAENIIKLATEAAKAEASRVSMEAIAKTSGAPLSTTELPKNDAPNFPDMVAASIAKGSAKGVAIRQLIKDQPAAYAEWLKSGKTGAL